MKKKDNRWKQIISLQIIAKEAELRASTFNQKEQRKSEDAYSTLRVDRQSLEMAA